MVLVEQRPELVRSLNVFPFIEIFNLDKYIVTE